jgi:hypothetical protein
MSDKTKMVWLVALIAVAAMVWYFGSKGPSTIVVNGLPVATFSYNPLAVENPELQRAKLEASQKTEYKSSGRDLFTGFAPPPVETARTEERSVAQGPVIPPPPPPPALPASMKFFGYGTVPNGTGRRAFLADGDEVYIVGEGDTLLGKYRVVKIGNANLDFEEIATGRRGSTSLSEDQGATPAS